MGMTCSVSRDLYHLLSSYHKSIGDHAPGLVDDVSNIVAKLDWILMFLFAMLGQLQILENQGWCKVHTSTALNLVNVWSASDVNVFAWLSSSLSQKEIVFLLFFLTRLLDRKILRGWSKRVCFVEALLDSFHWVIIPYLSSLPTKPWIDEMITTLNLSQERWGLES